MCATDGNAVVNDTRVHDKKSADLACTQEPISHRGLEKLMANHGSTCDALRRTVRVVPNVRHVAQLDDAVSIDETLSGALVARYRIEISESDN
jgi:hypothetical protein